MKKILSLSIIFFYLSCKASSVHDAPLSPHSLAVAAKVLINRGKNDDAAALVQKNLNLVQGSKNKYVIELNSLIDEKLVQQWMNKGALQSIATSTDKSGVMQTSVVPALTQQS